MFKKNEVFSEPLEIQQRIVKKCVPRHFHLYKEKVYHISKKNGQTLTTGYRPDESSRFKLFLRFDDYRYGDCLNLTLFQFVSLMKDLRSIIYESDALEILDKIDASIQFSFKEINVPKVSIETDASITSPSLFQLSIAEKDKQLNFILLERKTLQRVIESEAEILNTIDTIEDRPASFLLENFIGKCVTHLQNEKTELKETKVFIAIKSSVKTSFQSEVFLKFWPLVYKLIESKLKNTSDKCEDMSKSK